MTDVLKSFNDCISDLENEIKGIEKGDYDSDLLAVSSYAIKSEYDAVIGSYCDFANPPVFSDVEDTGDDESESAKTPSSEKTERRVSSRSSKKRKSEALDSEVYFIFRYFSLNQIMTLL